MNFSRRFVRLLPIFITGLLLANPFGSTGKISGVVTDAKTGEALPTVNVLVQGTTLGATADLEGRYVILNVPPGVYTVAASFIGYQKVEVQNVRVSVDFTTSLDIKMSEGSIELQANVIQGERNPLVRKDLTNPIASISADQIAVLPVDDVVDVIRLQSGVVIDNGGGIHIRGGRSNEISYTVNGLSINNPLNNNQAIGIATNALQEVSVSTGTFSAEYGDALSGVVNYVTKEGGERYKGSFRTFLGDNYSSRKDIFFNIDDIRPLNHTKMEGTLGGPLFGLLNGATFFVSGTHEKSDGYMYGVRIFNPTDSYLARNQFPSSDPRYAAGGDTLPYVFNPYSLSSTGQPTGDGAIVPMNTREGLTVTGKIAVIPFSASKITYDFLYSEGTSRGFSQDYRFNPDGRGTFHSFNTSHSVGFTQTLNERAFYTLKVGYSRSRSWNFNDDDIATAGYLPSFYSAVLPNTAFLTGGVSSDRTKSVASSLTVKLDGVAQLFGDHEVKFGGDLKMDHIEVNSYVLQFDKTLSSQLLLDTTRSYTPFVPTPAVAPDNLSYADYARSPIRASFYLLDKIELFKSMILNLGLRYEYFDPAADYITDISAALANQGADLKLSTNIAPAEKKSSLAPRISVSYPITDQGIIRFSYGHFYQYPTYTDPAGNLRLSSIYRNPDEKSPTSSNPFYGNPNLKPQRSIQYEIGVQQGLSDDLKFDLTGFYKDVTNYIEVQTVRTGLGDRIYTVLANLNYANVKGISFSLSKRRSNEGLFSGSLDYTFTSAVGNRTDADAFLYDEKTGKQSEKLFVPLTFDRAHVLNGTATFSSSGDWTVSLIGSMQTGSPYTPALPSDLAPVKFDQNSARRPLNWNIDLNAEKYFSFAGADMSIFVRIDNVFDTQNEIFIFENSGQSLYSLDQVTNARIFDNLRYRVGRGDFGDPTNGTSLGARLSSALDKYYQRAEWLSAPREVRLGWSILF